MMKNLMLVNSLTLQTQLPHSLVMMDILCMDMTQHTVQYQIQEIGLKKHQLAEVIKLKSTIFLSRSTNEGYRFSRITACRIYSLFYALL